MYNLGIVYGKELALYSFGPSHPFRAERLEAFWNLASKLKDKVKLIKPVLASEDDVLLFHTKEYVDFVKAKSKEGTGLLDYGDTPAFKGVYEASCWYVGSVLQCLKLILDKDVKRAFCPIAGLHHAHRDRASGFCVFNDAGIAIEKAKKDYNIKRILYVDIDAHHGDGVFYAFEEDPDVWIADIHQAMLYPGTGNEEETGKGKAEGTKLNIPLIPGSGDEEFKLAFDKVVNFANKARPELIILQCGGDGMAGDPITQLEYQNAHKYAAEKLKEIADKFCEGKILAVGGGGYNLQNTAKAWTSICKVFLE